MDWLIDTQYRTIFVELHITNMDAPTEGLIYGMRETSVLCT
jgi:hypothetical protein